ncbi:OmpH family outer membrane protein [Roseivirga pacifica]|uniref:OmpH family outer membrane protein n=1 Tax=Roseivirga pacifica TaxID=1267423 RepID=UPI00209513AC|nr:OmpH family outer membrane protein [Roseivirga pacifica]MCO6359442.1 OmpH family outer membrane protein [Roseivirga pacifica]MCO6366812.1 OmpH family outer membrane protein [Roseivirga pacifica]MCO6370656.1 OmpH family outer membrane protein [Roseivirga pacifica]MCO6374468.1 OmpH family outer membrane protein [Roseivirga pacifica]MCO6379727.1 OmpH family outer membrane protein [Roseivirga pacifica]
MKRKFLMAAALILVAVASQAQGTKIGYTNIDYIVYNMPELEGIQSELATYEKQLGQQVQAKQTNLQAKYQELQQMAQQPNPNTVVFQEKQNEFQKLQGEVQQFAAQAEQALRAKEGEKMNPVYEKVQNAIEEVRKEGGFAMILNSQIAGVGGIVLASDEELNITEKVFAKLGVPMPAAPADNPATAGTGEGN